MRESKRTEDVAPPRLIAGKAHFSLNSGSFRLPLADVARAAQRSGFEGIELWARDISGELPSPQIGELLRKYNLRVSAFQVLRDYEGAPERVRSQQLEEAERMMADMASIGADTLLLCANTASNSSSDGGQIVTDLARLAAMAAERGVRIAFEPLAWSRWLNDYEHALACVEAVNHAALGLAVDTFHWFWAGTPLEFARRIPIHKCFEIQLCDARPSGLSPIQVARHHRLFPGEGIWPVAELASEFRSLGFDGFYNLEVFNDAYKDLPMEVFMSRAVSSLNSLF